MKTDDSFSSIHFNLRYIILKSYLLEFLFLISPKFHSFNSNFLSTFFVSDTVSIKDKVPALMELMF